MEITNISYEYMYLLQGIVTAIIIILTMLALLYFIKKTNAYDSIYGDTILIGVLIVGTVLFMGTIVLTDIWFTKSKYNVVISKNYEMENNAIIYADKKHIAVNIYNRETLRSDDVSYHVYYKCKNPVVYNNTIKTGYALGFIKLESEPVERAVAHCLKD